MSRTITFVLQPPIWASQREKELRLAEIRSHATKVTSARIKQKRRAIQLVPPQTKTVYAPSPGSVLDEKDLDPFNSAAIPVTPLVKWSIEHWERIYVFTLVQPMTSAAVNLPALHAWNQEIKRIIGEEMILHGAYAGALGYLLTHSNVAGRYKKLREQYLFHSGQCVSLIQRKLIAGHVSERTILAVWFAGCSSFAELDMKTCRMHFQGAKQLTDFLGGLQALRSWSLKVLLIVMDLIAAGIVLERTYFPVATWGTGPWQEQSPIEFRPIPFQQAISVAVPQSIG